MSRTPAQARRYHHRPDRKAWKNYGVRLGDTVGYSAHYLRSTGQHVGPAAVRRGVVVSIKPIDSRRATVYVRWDDLDPTEDAQAVLSSNLSVPGTLRFGDPSVTP
jgi:hypothetical protein